MLRRLLCTLLSVSQVFLNSAPVLAQNTLRGSIEGKTKAGLEAALGKEPAPARFSSPLRPTAAGSEEEKPAAPKSRRNLVKFIGTSGAVLFALGLIGFFTARGNITLNFTKSSRPKETAGNVGVPPEKLWTSVKNSLPPRVEVKRPALLAGFPHSLDELKRDYPKIKDWVRPIDSKISDIRAAIETVRAEKLALEQKKRDALAGVDGLKAKRQELEANEVKVEAEILKKNAVMREKDGLVGFARIDLNRHERLLRDAAVSRQEWEASQGRLLQAQTELEKARAELLPVQKELKAAQAAIKANEQATKSAIAGVPVIEEEMAAKDRLIAAKHQQIEVEEKTVRDQLGERVASADIDPVLQARLVVYMAETGMTETHSRLSDVLQQLDTRFSSVARNEDEREKWALVQAAVVYAFRKFGEKAGEKASVVELEKLRDKRNRHNELRFSDLAVYQLERYYSDGKAGGGPALTLLQPVPAQSEPPLLDQKYFLPSPTGARKWDSIDRAQQKELRLAGEEPDFGLTAREKDKIKTKLREGAFDAASINDLLKKNHGSLAYAAYLVRGNPELAPLLVLLADHPSPLVRGWAVWSLRQFSLAGERAEDHADPRFPIFERLLLKEHDDFVKGQLPALLATMDTAQAKRGFEMILFPGRFPELDGAPLPSDYVKVKTMLAIQYLADQEQVKSQRRSWEYAKLVRDMIRDAAREEGDPSGRTAFLPATNLGPVYDAAFDAAQAIGEANPEEGRLVKLWDDEADLAIKEGRSGYLVYTVLPLLRVVDSSAFDQRWSALDTRSALLWDTYIGSRSWMLWTPLILLLALRYVRGREQREAEDWWSKFTLPIGFTPRPSPNRGWRELVSPSTLERDPENPWALLRSYRAALAEWKEISEGRAGHHLFPDSVRAVSLIAEELFMQLHRPEPSEQAQTGPLALQGSADQVLNEVGELAALLKEHARLLWIEAEMYDGEGQAEEKEEVLQSLQRDVAPLLSYVEMYLTMLDYMMLLEWNTGQSESHWKVSQEILGHAKHQAEGAVQLHALERLLHPLAYAYRPESEDPLWSSDKSRDVKKAEELAGEAVQAWMKKLSSRVTQPTDEERRNAEQKRTMGGRTEWSQQRHDQFLLAVTLTSLGALGIFAGGVGSAWWESITHLLERPSVGAGLQAGLFTGFVALLATYGFGFRILRSRGALSQARQNIADRHAGRQRELKALTAEIEKIPAGSAAERGSLPSASAGVEEAAKRFRDLLQRTANQRAVLASLTPPAQVMIISIGNIPDEGERGRRIQELERVRKGNPILNRTLAVYLDDRLNGAPPEEQGPSGSLFAKLKGTEHLQPDQATADFLLRLLNDPGILELNGEALLSLVKEDRKWKTGRFTEEDLDLSKAPPSVRERLSDPLTVSLCYAARNANLTTPTPLGIPYEEALLDGLQAALAFREGGQRGTVLVERTAASFNVGLRLGSHLNPGQRYMDIARVPKKLIGEHKLSALKVQQPNVLIKFYTGGGTPEDDREINRRSILSLDSDAYTWRGLSAGPFDQDLADAHHAMWNLFKEYGRLDLKGRSVLSWISALSTAAGFRGIEQGRFWEVPFIAVTGDVENSRTYLEGPLWLQLAGQIPSVAPNLTEEEASALKRHLTAFFDRSDEVFREKLQAHSPVKTFSLPVRRDEKISLRLPDEPVEDLGGYLARQLEEHFGIPPVSTSFRIVPDRPVLSRPSPAASPSKPRAPPAPISTPPPEPIPLLITSTTERVAYYEVDEHSGKLVQSWSRYPSRQGSGLIHEGRLYTYNAQGQLSGRREQTLLLPSGESQEMFQEEMLTSITWDDPGRVSSYKGTRVVSEKPQVFQGTYRYPDGNTFVPSRLIVETADQERTLFVPLPQDGQFLRVVYRPLVFNGETIRARTLIRVEDPSLLPLGESLDDKEIALRGLLEERFKKLGRDLVRGALASSLIWTVFPNGIEDPLVMLRTREVRTRWVQARIPGLPGRIPDPDLGERYEQSEEKISNRLVAKTGEGWQLVELAGAADPSVPPPLPFSPLADALELPPEDAAHPALVPAALPVPRSSLGDPNPPDQPLPKPPDRVEPTEPVVARAPEPPPARPPVVPPLPPAPSATASLATPPAPSPAPQFGLRQWGTHSAAALFGALLMLPLVLMRGADNNSEIPKGPAPKKSPLNQKPEEERQARERQEEQRRQRALEQQAAARRQAQERQRVEDENRRQAEAQRRAQELRAKEQLERELRGQTKAGPSPVGERPGAGKELFEGVAKGRGPAAAASQAGTWKGSSNAGEAGIDRPAVPVNPAPRKTVFDLPENLRPLAPLTGDPIPPAVIFHISPSYHSRHQEVLDAVQEKLPGTRVVGIVWSGREGQIRKESTFSSGVVWGYAGYGKLDQVFGGSNHYPLVVAYSHTGEEIFRSQGWLDSDKQVQLEEKVQAYLGSAASLATPPPPEKTGYAKEGFSSMGSPPGAAKPHVFLGQGKGKEPAKAPQQPETLKGTTQEKPAGENSGAGAPPPPPELPPGGSYWQLPEVLKKNQALTVVPNYPVLGLTWVKGTNTLGEAVEGIAIPNEGGYGSLVSKETLKTVALFNKDGDLLSKNSAALKPAEKELELLRKILRVPAQETPVEPKSSGSGGPPPVPAASPVPSSLEPVASLLENRMAPLTLVHLQLYPTSQSLAPFARLQETYGQKGLKVLIVDATGVRDDVVVSPFSSPALTVVRMRNSQAERIFGEPRTYPSQILLDSKGNRVWRTDGLLSSEPDWAPLIEAINGILPPTGSLASGGSGPPPPDPLKAMAAAGVEQLGMEVPEYSVVYDLTGRFVLLDGRPFSVIDPAGTRFLDGLVAQPELNGVFLLGSSEPASMDDYVRDRTAALGLNVHLYIGKDLLGGKSAVELSGALPVGGTVHVVGNAPDQIQAALRDVASRLESGQPVVMIVGPDYEDPLSVTFGSAAGGHPFGLTAAVVHSLGEVPPLSVLALLLRNTGRTSRIVEIGAGAEEEQRRLFVTSLAA